MKILCLYTMALALLAGCQTLPQSAVAHNQGVQIVSNQTSERHAMNGQAVPLKASQLNTIVGKSAVPIVHQQQTYWLLTSESQGLTLTDANGKVLSNLAGNMEALDLRHNIQIANRTYTVISTQDNNLGQVLVVGLDWQSKELSLLNTLAKTDAQIEALCWYKMPQGHLSLFMANTIGVIEQRIIVDGNKQSLLDESVHQFIGAPETKACAVDDASASLYLVEENIGVWRYSADPESELIRDLVTTVKPFGPLHGEVTDVEVLTNGDLLVSTPEQQGVWYLDMTHNATASFVSLKGTDKPETIHALQQDSRLLLGIYDDGSEQYLTAELSLRLTARQSQNSPIKPITAFAQTEPVKAFGDAADDPAIWINSTNPELSRVLGTNKKQGLLVYDLQGQLLQELNVGRVNNVDLRYGFTLGDKVIDLATASNRTTQSISLFSIHPDSGDMAFLSDIKTNLTDIYGACMFQDNQNYYVFVNDTQGRYQQYLLVTENNQINGKLIREFKVPSQPEGCVADDVNKQLYLGEEATGIWQVTAEPIDMPLELIITTSETFVADVEGMGIYIMDGAQYLVASSQGNNSYGVFALEQNNRYLGSFKIDMDLETMIDGVSETDGLEITSQSLGANLPDGLLVVQDGRNRLSNAPQNFKLVDGKHIKQLINTWLKE